MTELPIPLTALSEAQRAQATQRFTIIRSVLEDGVTQTQVASTHHISVSTECQPKERWEKERVQGSRPKERRMKADGTDTKKDPDSIRER
jgi:hypothetical protein